MCSACFWLLSVFETFRLLDILNYEGAETNKTKIDNIIRVCVFCLFLLFSVFETFRFLGRLAYVGAENKKRKEQTTNDRIRFIDLCIFMFLNHLRF